MKRSPMPARKTPLETKTALRRTALNRSPAASSLAHDRAKRSNQPKRQTAQRVPAALRKALAARSGGLCEIGNGGCAGAATDLAHRKKVGAGGRRGEAAKAHHVLSNALAACHPCHSRGHLMPAEAYRHGWMLREHENPAAAPVIYRGQRRWLTDDGSVLASPPTAEEATDD
jgi:hypothetical protein